MFNKKGGKHKKGVQLLQIATKKKDKKKKKQKWVKEKPDYYSYSFRAQSRKIKQMCP